MPDEQGSSTRSEEDSRSGLWAGIRTLLFGGNSEPSLREQIEEVIDEAEEEGDERRGSSVVGDLSLIERKMVRNLLHFGEQTVDDVAVPRGEIIAIPESATFAEIVAVFAPDSGEIKLSPGGLGADLTTTDPARIRATLAAAEAAVGLAFLVTFLRNRGDIAVDDASVMKG